MRSSSAPQVVALQEPFDVFYRRELRGVVALAYALSGSRWAAEDLAQEAFLTAHRQWDRISQYDAPAQWVRRVVSNMAVSSYRKRASEARALLKVAAQRQSPLPELQAPDNEFWHHVRALPKRQAQALALHYLEDRPVAEVAQILQCAVSTAKVHLHKGRQSLAQRLTAEELA